MLEGIIFVVITAAAIYVSRASLRAPGSHGFYRFFVWECLLILFLLNMRVWWDAPFSAHQSISWLLLLVSLLLVFPSLYQLRRQGKADPDRADPALLTMEKTSVLVTTGVYRYIRHPLYSSLLFLGWGIFFKAPAWGGAVLAAVATLCLLLTARAEERENLHYFGPAYRAYMARTKMFVPFLF